MRALVVTEPGSFALRDIPPPAPDPYQALVRITCCGVCNSTDWKVINGQMPWAGTYPLVLGHESVGTVEAVGDHVRKFRIGDMVTRPIYPRSEKMGSAWGGFAEYGVVTDASAMADDGDPSLLDDYNAQRQNVVPGGLDPVSAALAISLAETASVLDGIPPVAGRRVLIAGTGIAGLALTLWCKLAGGGPVVTLGRRAERLEKARQLGADQAVATTAADWKPRVRRALGGDAHIVIDAIGDLRFADHLLDLVEPSGSCIAYGAPADGEAYTPRWHSASVNEQNRYGWVCGLLAKGLIIPERLISHRWALDEAVVAFEQARRGEVCKGFIELGD